MKKVNLQEILMGVLLGMAISLIISVGARTLFKNGTRNCLKCGAIVSGVSEHDMRCFLCNHSYWSCQKQHTHCPGCKVVLSDSSEHLKTCSSCGVKYFRCRNHVCNLPWDYSHSDVESEQEQVQELLPTGTLRRPPVNDDVINR